MPGVFILAADHVETQREREKDGDEIHVIKLSPFMEKKAKNIGITTKKTPSPEANNFSLFESARASILINDWKNDKRTLYTARS
jgi:hypothetical protein